MAEPEATADDFCDAPPFSVEAQGHSLHFFPAGKDRLEALVGLIEGARESLRLVFYIFATDECGVRVRDALAAAARRGVAVHLILDGFGAAADDQFLADLIEAGGKIRRFLPKWTRRYLIRNHQKIVIADGRVAMLGGFNIEQSYFAPPGEDSWNDLAFTVEGPVVERVVKWFGDLEDCASRRKAQFRTIVRKVGRWDTGTGPVQLLIGGPTTRHSSWSRGIGQDLVDGDRLDMAVAYFSPSLRLENRIRRIARKGQVRLLLAAKSDNTATIAASRALYRKLLAAGARIWEFQPCRLHTKLIVLDDAVYVGSSNFDLRSLRLNLEIVLRIEDAGLAARMCEHFEYLLQAAEEITPELHAARATWLNRLRWRVSWFLVVALDYTVSRRLNLGM